MPHEIPEQEVKRGATDSPAASGSPFSASPQPRRPAPDAAPELREAAESALRRPTKNGVTVSDAEAKELAQGVLDLWQCVFVLRGFIAETLTNDEAWRSQAREVLDRTEGKLSDAA